MKKSLRLIYSFFVLLTLTVFSGCELGMGASVDLEAPVVEILAPKKLSNVHLEFEMSGTCSDNIGVTEVNISNFDTGKNYGNAKISGNNWSFPMVLTKEEEGAITFLVTASDKAGNESTRSKKTITLLVDDTNPQSQDWFIERGNGIFINLYSKSYLQNIDTEVSVNKDLSQNQSFVIHGKVSDTMSIKTTQIILKDEQGRPIITKTVEGLYTPTATFTHDEIVAANSAYATGKHYINVAYVCTDDHDNFIANDVNWFIWYPESDIPHISQKDTDARTNELHIKVQNSIPVDYFDDDQVDELMVALKNECELVGIDEELLKEDAATREAVFKVVYDTNTDTTKKEFAKIETPHEGTRDNTFVIPTEAVQVSAQMKLVVCIKDSNGIWNSKIISVFITDGELPNLYIERPVQNTIPEIKSVEGEESVFEVSGYVLDKRNGPGKIEVVYIPTDVYDDSDKQKNKATEILEDFLTTDVAEDTRKDYSNGIFVKWQTVTTDNNFTDPTDEGWHRRTYSFDLDMIDDFGSNGKASKYFGLIYTDENGNSVYQGLSVSGDEIKPSIEIASPATDMSVVNPETGDPETGKFLLKFKGTKASRLGMNSETYKITVNEGTANEIVYSTENGKLTADGGYYKYELSTTELKALKAITSQPTFKFYVEDKLGNSAEDRRTVVLSVLPKAISITADSLDGTYKKDEEIKFKLNFDKEVKVTGTPKLVLYYNSTDNTEKYAIYDSGSETKTLTFIYTVPDGVIAEKVMCPATDYVVLGSGAKIETANIGSGNAACPDLTGKVLQRDIPKDDGEGGTDGEVVTKDAEIKIDSVAPVFRSISVTTENGVEITTIENEVVVSSIKYLKKDDEIKAVLTANENILVTGSPTLILKAGDNDLQFDFQGLNNNELTFIHKVSSANGAVALNETEYFSETDRALITDEVGNTMTSLQTLTNNSPKSITIDTIKPATPVLKVKEDGSDTQVDLDSTYAASVKTKAQTLFFDTTVLEATASVYYSFNGGSSWIPLTAAEKTNGILLPQGTSSITAKQVDIAGNESGTPTKVSLNIQARFPAVTNLSITDANGYYKTGDTITVELSFDGNVKVSDNNTKLTFTDYSGAGSGSFTFAQTQADGQKTITATYTVQANDVFNGIKITDLTGALKDVYAKSFTDTDGNFAALLKDDNGWRENIKVDGVNPTIVLNECVPANNGVSAIRGTAVGNDRFTVTLKFSENVYKESGYITLQRIGANTGADLNNWAIPAVLSFDDFTNIYNQLGTTDREKLMETISGQGKGSEKLQDNTVRPLGPYMKLTQGIQASGAPDQTTKYVLAPEYGLFGTTGTVNDIRTVLAKTGYHQHKVDVNSSAVAISGDTVTITFNDKIEDGQHWILLVDSTCFRDNAKNFYAGMTTASPAYNFWSKQVAQPVVRVDRYSHNIGAHEPKLDSAPADGYQVVSSVSTQDILTWNDNDTAYNTASATSATKLIPTGYAKVRIDCETPGAVIKFKVYTNATNNGATSGTNAAPDTATYDTHGKVSNISDKATSTMADTPTVAYTLGQWIVVGDGKHNSARKDYVCAQATAPTSASSMADSALGYEGVFKTVVHSTANNAENAKQVQIQGGTFNGGMPSIPGFPLRDAVTGDDSKRYNQNSYQTNGTNTADHYWVTYDIVSEYSILLVVNASGWSQNYSYGSYGQISSLSGVPHW